MRHMAGHREDLDTYMLVDDLADEFEPELEEVSFEPTKHEIVIESNM